MSRAHGVEGENKRIDRKKVFWRTRLEEVGRDEKGKNTGTDWEMKE